MRKNKESKALQKELFSDKEVTDLPEKGTGSGVYHIDSQSLVKGKGMEKLSCNFRLH